jgi:hypothetical protein
MSEVKLYIRRGFTVFPGDIEAQKVLVAERKKLFDGLVNTLDLEVKDRGEMDNPEPPHEVVEVIIALGTAGAFTALVNICKVWLDSKKIPSVKFELRNADGELVTLTIEGATSEQFDTIASEFAPLFSQKRSL